MKRIVILFVFLSLSVACAPRGVVTLLPPDAPVVGQVHPVFVATNRGRADPAQARSRRNFAHTRMVDLQFARIDISVPPNHTLGQIEWPKSQIADAAQHFVTVAETHFEDSKALAQAMQAAHPGKNDEVLVFVHGYNVNNAEATYRLAQIAHDFQLDSPVVSFSWPSAGNTRGYVYDRDSIIFSRDGFETLLTHLVDNDMQVQIVAHSMGSQLVMETLRQISISGNRSVLRGVSGVALISPDIDNEVFVQQAKRIEPFPKPFVLVTSARDKILGLSAFITGKPNRLGAIQDDAPLGDLPVEIVDLSRIEGGDVAGHATAFTAPVAIRLLRRLRGGT